MKKIQKINIDNKLHVFLLLATFVVIFYSRSIFAFFQADEWFYFTQFLPLTGKWYGVFSSIYKSVFESHAVSGGGHMAPIMNISWYFNNLLFGLNFIPYILLSLFFHVLNAFFIYLILKRLNNLPRVGFIAAVFFGLSYVHQQAVTWVIAFSTTLSVTLILSAILCLLQITRENEKDNIRNIRIAFILFLSSILTKEISVVLFIIFPFIWFTILKKSLKKRFIKYYAILSAFYIFFRAGIPYLFFWADKQIALNAKSENFFDIPLLIFRAITYPLRLIVEVFVPAELILWFVEALTSYAYPHYALEKSVRGTNYLTFIQSAGSDMFIFFFSGIILIMFFLYIFKLRKKQKNKFYTANIAILIITFSALPLIMIATYAPWWGYVTFIDSRHLYIASVGASFLFALIIEDIGLYFNKFFLKHRFLKMNPFRISMVIVILWAFTQFVLLQGELIKQVKTGSERKKILSEVLNQTLPRDKTVFLIKSNTGYYGFGPIPPFQTNLGQILSIYYYKNRGLPEYFIRNNFLVKGGIAGEGYVEFNGKGFGYYINEDTLFSDIKEGKLEPGNISAYNWNGEDGTISNITDEVRKEARRYLGYLNTFSGWKEFYDPEGYFHFKFPQDFALEDITNSDKSTDSSVIRSVIISDVSGSGSIHKINIKLKSKQELIPFSEHVSLQSNSEGKIIAKDFTFRNINMANRNAITTIYSTNTYYPNYYIPYDKNNMYFDIKVSGERFRRQFIYAPVGQIEKYNSEVEKILSTLDYEKPESK